MNQQATLQELELTMAQAQADAIEATRIIAETSIQIRDAKKALLKPGNKVRLTGDAGNLIVEGRLIETKGLVNGEGCVALITKQGELRLWPEAGFMALNIEVLREG